MAALCGRRRGWRPEANARFAVDVFLAPPGLPSSAVLAVAQTRDGYLWAGTLAGAAVRQFEFTVFDENNTPGLSSSSQVDACIWIGEGNCGLAPRTEKLRWRETDN